MNENYKFILHTTYDKPAYQALSEVSWVLFRKHRMQVAAYPALFSLAALIAIILIFNWAVWSSSACNFWSFLWEPSAPSIRCAAPPLRRFPRQGPFPYRCGLCSWTSRFIPPSTMRCPPFPMAPLTA